MTNNAVLYAPCGIDCSVCDAYKATQTDDTALFQKLAENYEKQFDKKIDPETLRCDGCASDNRHIGFCAVCSIRSCAFAKGFSTCAECDAFPCEKGSFIWVEGSKSKATLEMLKSNTKINKL